MTLPRTLLAAAALALLSIPAGALAQVPPGAPPGAAAPAARGPSMALALEAAETAIAACAANGYAVGASVIDSGGVLKVVLAADGARPIGVPASARKALASNKYRISSGELEAKAKADPVLTATLAADPAILARAGAFPMMVGPDLIGSIGVGGAPGGDKDEACAKAGLAKVAVRLK
jgi:uncharacterized protein GlcG (DUF336 family)